jgi:hypothetical protein
MKNSDITLGQITQPTKGKAIALVTETHSILLPIKETEAWEIYDIDQAEESDPTPILSTYDALMVLQFLKK